MNVVTSSGANLVQADRESETERLRLLHALERKLLWLSAWMIHHANHVRPNRDGLKVGGHQASSASMVDIMVALWFHELTALDQD